MKGATTFAESVGAAMAYLEVPGDGTAKPVVFALHDEVVIGREPQDSLSSDKFLCIPDHTVSRRHARIRRRGSTYFVEDLHSFNGTFVLGNRLRPGSWHPLRDGDELAVSSAQMIFHSLVVPAQDNMTTIITKTVDATQLAKTMEPPAAADDGDMQRTVRKLHAMAQVSIALGAVTDRATLIEKIMNFIFDLFPLAERAFILLRKSEGEAPVPVAASRRDGKVEDPEHVTISHTIVGEVLDKKQSILSVDTLANRHYGAQESIISQGIRSVMCVPLLLEGECLGLIQVDTSSDPYAFKEQDLEMLTGVCAETAVALKNFQLYSDIERLLDGFVRASVQAIEERDPVTAGHSFRVASYAEGLAQAVDRDTGPELRRIAFSHEQLREIRYAALLHDFGKVGVREHVLRKEKKLHHSEMRLLEQRFKYARACLERQAYRLLAELHARRELSIGAFRAEKIRIEAGLREEYERLDRFLDAIRRANEPAVSHTEGRGELDDILDYAYHEADGLASPLLEQCEFSALSLPRGCLTPEERKEIESHVVDSYSFLILIPWTRDLSGVPAIAHGHHEKLDGSGYPMGLRGDQISIQTRMLTICDIWDALTAGDRPYKKAVPTEQALDLMAQECRAGHLDSRLFNVFVDAKVWTAAATSVAK
ncbi:HD domain-containing phosphohydrolase [Noviherbaspirillum autotrophicum]|uniref:Metal-dependent phosphohydrolase n=1 Tax=Noviherbaspirillum autotrophicum TaxID=709839 RepID=A0A0C1YLR2_9BURK|nr:HD domain-containing phosphohydrolase [Noviherbaspirillum autotrophicum]KIF81427.1 metal-dependent phosphohydrolase [Noviherbaspirillum autotrophicum]